MLIATIKRNKGTFYKNSAEVAVANPQEIVGNGYQYEARKEEATENSEDVVCSQIGVQHNLKLPSR